MNKTLLTLVFLISFLTSIAQTDSKWSYGLVGGNYIYFFNNLDSSYGFENNRTKTSLNVGGYFEYQFARKFGVKTSLTYRSASPDYHVNTRVQYFTGNVKINFLDITPLIKYDCGSTYRKGFYMVFGPKISFITKAEEDGEDVKDVFNSSSYGFQYGIGTRIAKVVDLEIKLDYEVEPFFDRGKGVETHTYGINTLLYVDLQRIFFSKKP
ncbi:MAG: PorT family protein [Bacteroidetes bacterium]|nr:PorT family protein [Bacteroidota bacterium]